MNIALGGWTLSAHFSTAVRTATKRKTFAENVAAFLGQYQMDDGQPLFDGIDLDWEYPGGGGLSGNSVHPDDGLNYGLFAEQLRLALDNKFPNKHVRITTASPGGFDKIAKFGLDGLVPYLDAFHVMTYDFHGTWEDVTGHNAPFTADDKYSIQHSVKRHLEEGVPAAKIALGSPLYGRTWRQVKAGSNPNLPGYNQAGDPNNAGHGNEPLYDVKQLEPLIRVQGWKPYYDEEQQALYVYSESQGIFSSLESRASTAAKADYVCRMGLGGMMFWDISNEDINTSGLVSSAR